MPENGEPEERAGEPGSLQPADSSWEERAKGLPDSPGVYLFLDREGRALYVGKAKNLRSRVRAYLKDSGDTRYHIQFLREKIADLEFIVTDTEAEALILENNLIKARRPRYNIRLRDDKTFYHLRLTMGEPFPRLLLARRPTKGGRDLLFGPFPSGSAVKETIRLLQELFPLRRCSGRGFRRRDRPCLNYQIGKCAGPCADLIAEPEYQKLVEQTLLFLKGKKPELMAELKREMELAAEALEFEKAAILRDRLQAVEKTLEPQKVDSVKPVERDVIGFFREGDRVTIQRLGYRKGVLLVSEAQSFAHVSFPDDEILSSFLGQLYAEPRRPAEEILVPFLPADHELLLDTFSRTIGKKVVMRVPERGEGKKLLLLAERNAALAGKREKGKAEEVGTALAELKSRLRLRELPRWIEGVDISLLAGEHPVGAMVKFQEGEPEKSGYRRFLIKTVAGTNDYEMMREVLTRRFQRALAEKQKLPDLLLVDGGKGQLNVARAVLTELGLAHLPVIALAKDRPLAQTPRQPKNSSLPQSGGPPSEQRRPKKKGERVFMVGVKDPLHFKPTSAGLRLLLQVRDEAHRFALAYHQRRRGRSFKRSSLEDLPGIGPKKARLLLQNFHGLAGLRLATKSELQGLPGISEKDAETIFAFFNPDLTPREE